MLLAELGHGRFIPAGARQGILACSFQIARSYRFLPLARGMGYHWVHGYGPAVHPHRWRGVTGVNCRTT